MAATLPEALRAVRGAGRPRRARSPSCPSRRPPASAPDASTGILTLVSGGARKALYLKDGRVVLRLEQPAQRPPGRDPDPRGQDHGRGVRQPRSRPSPRASARARCWWRWAPSPEGPLGGRAVPGQGDRLQRLPVGRGPVPLRGVVAPGEGAHHRRPRHPGPHPGRASGAWTPAGRVQARYPEGDSLLERAPARRRPPSRPYEATS